MNRTLFFLYIKVTGLATGTLLNGGFAWSGDGKNLFYQDILGTNQPLYRIGMNDRKRKQVTTFESFLHSGTQRALFMGLAPDGSLVARLDRDAADIYALDFDIH